MIAVLTLLVTLSLGLLAGCGGEATAPSPPASGAAQPSVRPTASTQPATVQPDGSTPVTMTEFRFTPIDIQAKRGTWVFYLVNAGTVAHDMTVLGDDGKHMAESDPVPPGGRAIFTVRDLPAGTFMVFCRQPGHEKAGMIATLHVS